MEPNKLENNNKKKGRIFSIGSMSNKEKCRRHKLENDNKKILDKIFFLIGIRTNRKKKKIIDYFFYYYIDIFFLY